MGAKMLIAHLPASYLWARLAQRRLDGKHLLPLGLLAGLLPDVDLLYFYFIDGRAHPHHSYWTHLPISWLLLAGLASVLVLWERRLRDISLVFFSNIALHLVLDTVAAGISWLYPLTARAVSLVSVPPAQAHWLLSFVLHWSFGLELAIAVAALVVLIRPRRRSSPRAKRDTIRSSVDLSIFKLAHRGRP